jgi:hypothetical protein
MTVTPPRRPRSIRRTTTHDCLRHDGLAGPVTVDARGRDLLTRADGTAQVLGTARLDMRADYRAGTIISITCDPPHPGLGTLAGARAHAGFRRAIDQAMPGERDSGSLRFQLLDDLPIALLLSGRAFKVAGVGINPGRPRQPASIDICAGWAADGTLVASLTELGPPLNTGPVAAAAAAGDDPLAWHEADALAPHSTRRRRRLDVWEEDGAAQAACYFRDTYFEENGTETVVHEYAVRGTVDPGTLRFTSCEADPGALPYPECPSAAASAQRLAGAPVDGLRRFVRGTFTGTTTCTHLNDTLRSLEDVGALLRSLRIMAA